MARVKTSVLIEKIHEYRGNLSAVARVLGVSRPTVYKRVHASVKVAEALSTARETMLDEAESVLYDKVLSGEDTTALIFFLKTRGKERGYVERQDLHHSGDNPFEVVVTWGDQDDSDSEPS